VPRRKISGWLVVVGLVLWAALLGGVVWLVLRDGVVLNRVPSMIPRHRSSGAVAIPGPSLVHWRDIDPRIPAHDAKPAT
jgi:hypothetical protein